MIEAGHAADTQRTESRAWWRWPEKSLTTSKQNHTVSYLRNRGGGRFEGTTNIVTEAHEVKRRILSLGPDLRMTLETFCQNCKYLNTFIA